jgi:molecular chaperone DnaK
VGKFIGIDLGTTNSCVAAVEGGSPKIIHNRQGGRVLPSVVAIRKDGQQLVGHPAKRQAITNPEQTIFGAKRLIGRKLDDFALKDWRETAPYNIVSALNGDAWVRINGRDFSPQEISAVIIEEIKNIAQDYLGEKVEDAVITVPAYFNDNQRQATKEAGVIAGLNVRKIINEPTAAALAYGINNGVDSENDQIIAVFDLGGGTFDITIIEAANGVFNVLASNGNSFLGGDDFNNKLVRHMISEFKTSSGFDLTKNACALQRLHEAAETAKCELSTAFTTAIDLPFIAVGPAGPLHLTHDPLSRDFLEQLNEELIGKLEAPCMTAFDDAGVDPGQIDQVVLVGGMTRMPAVQRKVEQIFNKKPAKNVNPDEIVALGAAAQCAILTGEMQEVVLLDVTPHSLGVKVFGDRMSVVVPKNTTIPTSVSRVYGTTRGVQDFINIDVYQGEESLVEDNTYLGRFILEGIKREKTGEFSVEVNFAIDTDGVVNITASEDETGAAASARIDPSSGLTSDQLERISRDHRRRSLKVGPPVS